MNFSPDLAFRVRNSLERLGYCIFGTNELNRLFSHPNESRGRRLVLEEFAALCGAKVETTPHFKSARFTKAAAVGS